MDGRGITIPVIDFSMNGTLFQCLIPSSGGELISSSIGVLTVTKSGRHQTITFIVMRTVRILYLIIGHFPVTSYNFSLLEIAHKYVFFSYNYLNLAWTTRDNEACHYFEVVMRYGCDANSENEVVVMVNNTRNGGVILQHKILLSSANSTALYYFNITPYNKQGNLSVDRPLEEFKIKLGSELHRSSHKLTLHDLSYIHAVVTKEVLFCWGDHFEPCSPCIDVPPLNERQTLILALPFLPAVTGLEEDLLCPVHPLPDERCVDLLSCNRFSKSSYSNSLTICRKSSNSRLEMCFHNVTKEMNGTRLHFFYSDLHCQPDAQLQSTRLYTESMQIRIYESNVLVSIFKVMQVK